MTKTFKCSMQKKKESLSKSNESVSTTEARKFVEAHSNGILSTLAEICAMSADVAIEDAAAVFTVVPYPRDVVVVAVVHHLIAHAEGDSLHGDFRLLLVRRV